ARGEAMNRVEKSVLLACDPARAFALFTEQAGAWWPPDRRHTRDPASEIKVLASGEFFERAADGTRVELGRVRSFEPPPRLVIDFFVGADAAHPPELVVTFAAEGEGTRVTVDHHPTPSSEEAWSRRAPVFVRSWDAVLAALGASAS